MSAPAWMPFYPADYLAATGHLTPAQHGAYLLLILHYWNKGGLPSEEKMLARIVRMSEREWRANRETLIEFFSSDWKHARIEKEIEKARTKSGARAEFGSRGGNAKALKNKEASMAKATILPEKIPSKALASSSQPEPDREEEHSSNACASDDTDLAFAEFNIIAVSAGWPKAQKLTAPRKANLRKRISDAGGLDGWKSAIQRGSRSSYLCGSKGWRADFDFFLQAKSFMKLLEGSYDDRPVISAQNHANGSGSAADQVLSIVRRRVAEVNPARWTPSQGGFDLDGNASANDLSGGSPIIDHDGQKAGCGVNDSRVSPLFLPSASRAFGGH